MKHDHVLSNILTGSDSAPVLPNCMPLIWFGIDGGRPPLAGGCGIGDGECAGEVDLTFICGVASDDD